MDPEQLLSMASKRPEPNVFGSFDCYDCREPVEGAVLNRTDNTLTWWCSQGHKSVAKDMGL